VQFLQIGYHYAGKWYRYMPGSANECKKRV
jgi:hypothetical protein